MYSPKIYEPYIPVLYKLKKQRGIPMTALVNEIIGKYLEEQNETSFNTRGRNTYFRDTG